MSKVKTLNESKTRPRKKASTPATGSGTSPRKPTGPALEAGALDEDMSKVNVKKKHVTTKEKTTMSNKEVTATATVVEAPSHTTMKTVLPTVVSTRLPGFIGNTLDKVPARYGIPAIILIAGLFIVRKLAQDNGVVIDQPEDPAIKA